MSDRRLGPLWIPVLLVSLLGAAAAAGDSPPPEPAVKAPSAEVTAPVGAVVSAPERFTFHLTLPAPAAPPCSPARLSEGQPCAVVFTLGTLVGVTALDLLLPVERRLTGLGDTAALPQGQWRFGQPRSAGPWVTGFSADPVFVGVGEFQMRSRAAP